MTEIKIKGNSGTSVELVYIEGTPRIIKKTNDLKYKSRLLLQCKKQIYFEKTIKNITVPKVLSNGDNYFEMEYIYMSDVISFFQLSKPDEILSKFDLILNFLESSLLNSKIETVNSEIFLFKINSIKSDLANKTNFESYNLIIDDLTDFLSKIKNFNIPIGLCHGDLTLSNILFSTSKNEIAFIDFLDSFIDTPLIDIAKIRQDVNNNWSAFICEKSFDIPKILIINNSLRQILHKRFKHLINTNLFYVIEMLNYLRIAPYVETVEKHNYLLRTLKKINYEFNNTCSR